MVSVDSEEEVIAQYRRWWNVHRIASAGLAVIGVYFIAKAVQEI